MESLLQFIYSGAAETIDYFSNPERRIYWPWMLTSFLLAAFVFVNHSLRNNHALSLQKFGRYVFHRRVWLHRSARTDYMLFIVNNYLKLILIVPWLGLATVLAYYVSQGLASAFGWRTWDWNPWLLLVLFVLTLTLLSDLLSFLLHRFMHRVPWLWEFHKVHHSAKVLNPFTLYRIHPFELVLINLRQVVAFGLVAGLFQYLSGGRMDFYQMAGVGVIHLAFLAAGANLRHSHVKLAYPQWLERILISPYQHQIHHSHLPEHYDRNFGGIFAFWDKLAGSLLLSSEVRRVRLGVPLKDSADYDGLIKVLWSPFRRIINGADGS